MNCFNIRELQGNLKRRFFSDLVNINDHRDFLDSTMIGLRFRTNNELNIYHDSLSFYNYGVTLESKSRVQLLDSVYTYKSNNSLMSFFNTNISLTELSSSVSNWFIVTISLAANSVSSSLFLSSSFLSMLNYGLINQVLSSLSNNFNFSFLSYSYKEQAVNNNQAPKESSSVVFESDNIVSTSPDLYSQLGSSSNYRNNLFTNPIIGYDFKCGHYLGI
jgi:hypothetical protein